MYSMVLMVAMTPTGDMAGFGKRGGGCNGMAYGCSGAVADHAGKASRAAAAACSASDTEASGARATVSSVAGLTTG